jgi:putative transposase
MTDYRRNFTQGGAYFFTLNLAERRQPLLTGNINRLRAALRYTRAWHPFETVAIVILPDHLHAIWRLPENDADFSTRWRLLKSAFSRALPMNEPISPSRRRRGERGIWQRRFWEHTIRDERDFARHVDYIHFNPVKHGYVRKVRDWLYSSFRRMVRLGIYPEDWGGDFQKDDCRFGEM